MATNETSQEISEFTSTCETEMSKENESMVENVREGVQGEPWEDLADTPFPDVLSDVVKNGMEFSSVPFWCGQTTAPKLVKNLSVYFSVDSVVTSQQILEAFDTAGIDIDYITSIQWRASNRSWIVSFDSPLAKETALEIASIEIGGSTVFLGDCENRLVLVKIYEAPNELPDTALIGRLSRYGRVLSFRRDKIAQFIDNGVRTARMTLNQHIPNIINVGGEIIRVWYSNQPKTCRNCGSPDHLVKDCNTTRCFNCEKPGHRVEECEEPRRCTVCHEESHELTCCPFVIHSANVETKKGGAKDEAKAGEKKPDDAERRKKQQQRRDEIKKKQEDEANKQRMQMQEKNRRDQQQAREKMSGEERRGEKSDREQQHRDHERKHRSREEGDERERESERARRDHRDYEKWKEAKRRERDRERDDYDRTRRDYRRDWSKRRDTSDDDSDSNWTVVRRRRYDRK